MRASEEIRADVLTELEWVPGLDESEIRIAVDDGVVTMTGHVPSWAERRKAEAAVKKVQGVQGVADDLEVRLSGSSRRDDTDVVESAIHALKWNYSVPQDRVTVTSDQGWLTLEGEVDWQYQRQAAEKAVANLVGVRHVANRITVKPRVGASDVRSKIESAFRRSAEIDARNLKVETDGSHVTLSGTVPSWSEWEEAESAAWSAPGVNQVTNRIQVRDETAVAF